MGLQSQHPSLFFGPLSRDKSVVKNVSLDPKAIKVNLVSSKSIKKRFLTDNSTTIFVDTAGVVE